MSINIGPPEVEELKPKIAVVGIGGAGGNAIANMIQANVEGVDFIVANTDAQALNSSAAEQRIQLGPDITQGLGAGSRPEVGRAAAEETIERIQESIEGIHMCFIAAGMGGGTGTGAAPVIAKAARERGVLTVGVVTKPFAFEGTRRMRAAEAGIEELQKNVDTLIVIPNQNLFLVANPNTTFKEAFLLADEVLQQGVRGITDLMVMPGLINLDFADVRTVMQEMGKAMMGTGEAEGDGRALEAAEKAIANPLLDGVSMQGAKGVIISITGGEDMRLMEVDEAANHIRELVDPEANIIWGSAFNDSLDGSIRVSVVATGIDSGAAIATEPSRAFSLHSQTGFGAGAGGASQAAKPEQADDEPDEPAEAASAQPGPTLAAASAPEEEENTVKPLDLRTRFSLRGGDKDSGDDEKAGDEADADEAIAEEARGEIGDAIGESDSEDRDSTSEGDGEEPAEDDELVLGLDQSVEDSDEESTGEAKEAEESEDTEADEQAADKEPPAPRVSTGEGTLFERMSSLSRRALVSDDDDESEDDEDPLNIPRFLNRQNNR